MKKLPCDIHILYVWLYTFVFKTNILLSAVVCYSICTYICFFPDFIGQCFNFSRNLKYLCLTCSQNRFPCVDHNINLIANINDMDTTSSTGRRRNNGCVNAEDNALNQITKEVCMPMNVYYIYWTQFLFPIFLR